ncbi:hypothetical protein AMTRI_Chr04g253270 [Amborella trichopoda]
MLLADEPFANADAAVGVDDPRDRVEDGDLALSESPSAIPLDVVPEVLNPPLLLTGPCSDKVPHYSAIPWWIEYMGMDDVPLSVVMEEIQARRRARTLVA